MSDLKARVTDYFVGGGLFNPELVNHEIVRDLIMDLANHNLKLDNEVTAFGAIVVTLTRKNELLREALQQVWDCEEDSACPDCKLMARQALKDTK